jgi:hypothetical protein
MMTYPVIQNFQQSHPEMTAEEPTRIQSRQEMQKMIRRRRVNGMFGAMEQFLKRKLGDRMNKSDLLELACSIETSRGIKLDRSAKRNREMLIVWFCEHWNDLLCTLQSSENHSTPTTLDEASHELLDYDVPLVGFSEDDRWEVDTWDLQE